MILIYLNSGTFSGMLHSIYFIYSFYSSGSTNCISSSTVYIPLFAKLASR